MRTETEVLTQIGNWARHDANIRAVLLTGSRANPRARLDFLSDYDVAIYANDRAPFQISDNWLNGFGSILARWPLSPDSTFDSNWLTRLVLFDDGSRIDFQISELRHLDPNEYDNGYRVIIDKDGVTDSLNTPTFTIFNINKPSQEQFESLVNEFWWDATYIPKYLIRNELPFAKYMLDAVLRYTHLHRVIEWHIGSRHDWAVNPGLRGKWFARYLDEQLWSAYKASHAGADIEENWRAFFLITELFAKLARQVAQHLGYRYPDDLDMKVTAYTAKLRQGNGEFF